MRPADAAEPPLLYRLTGDNNPIHADPERANVAGFPRPILHGLSSFGVAAHAMLSSAAITIPRGSPASRRVFAAAFPGETIRAEMWRDGSEVAFRGLALPRDDVALDNGLARLR